MTHRSDAVKSVTQKHILSKFCVGGDIKLKNFNLQFNEIKIFEIRNTAHAKFAENMILNYGFRSITSMSHTDDSHA